jgi:hypothetical protein
VPALIFFGLADKIQSNKCLTLRAKLALSFVLKSISLEVKQLEIFAAIGK